MTILSKLVDKMTSAYLLAIVSIITLFNVFLLYINKVSFLEIFLPLGLIAILWTISDRYIKKEWIFILTMFITAFMIRGIYGLVINSEPISDFKLMVNAAIMINDGDFTYKDWSYFIQWPYQLGFVAYQAFVLKLFNHSRSMLIVLNCLYMAVTSILVYGITKAIFNQKTARFASILNLSYFPFIYYASVLTNQHISTMFYMLAVWFIVRRKKMTLIDSICGGFALAIGQSFRPLAIVYLLAFVLYGIYTINFKKIKDSIPYISLIVSYLLIFKLLVLSITVMGISDQGLTNTDPYWKFVPGLNQAAYGRYNDVDNKMFLENPDAETRIEIEKEIISQRLKINPLEMISFQFIKIGSFWGDYENSIFGLNQYANSEISLYYEHYSFDQVFDLYKKSEKVIYTFLFIGVLMTSWKFNKEDKRSRFLIYLLCFYSGVHLLIEVSVRYRYDIMNIVIILAAKGLIDLIKSRKKGIRNEG